MASRGRILIVDDEANARAALSEILRDEGYATETAADGFKALGKLEEFAPDVVLTDLKMPGLDGIAFMEKAQSGAAPGAVFVVMTAFGTIASAVAGREEGRRQLPHQAARLRGARRPSSSARWRRPRLLQETRAAARAAPRAQRVRPHRQRRPEDARPCSSSSSRSARARRASSSRARAAPARSSSPRPSTPPRPRAKAPFVRLHCAALAESLLESELFGHERGAFTGAVARREGRFEQADGGTLFLDEIGEIPPGTQVKLLRVLQERTFERVGGNETLKVDVRIIAATNRDLAAEVERGAFREDLYYRLNVVTVELPPLRERGGDIAPLASFFLRRYATENGKRHRGLLRRRARAPRRATRWPGNVRELENVDRARGRPLRRAAHRGEAPAAGARRRKTSAKARRPFPGSTIARPRALRHPEDARGVRRLDLEGRDAPRRLTREDPVQAPRVRLAARGAPGAAASPLPAAPATKDRRGIG